MSVLYKSLNTRSFRNRNPALFLNTMRLLRCTAAESSAHLANYVLLHPYVGIILWGCEFARELLIKSNKFTTLLVEFVNCV